MASNFLHNEKSAELECRKRWFIIMALEKSDILREIVREGQEKRKG